MILLQIALWLVAAYVTTSAVEYAVHRWPMHSARLASRWPALGRQFEKHAQLHHGRFYGRQFELCADPAARYISVDINPALFVPMLTPVWLPVLLVDLTGGVVFLTCFTLHGVLWTLIHREMHEPRGRWFAGTRLYAFFRRYHLGHHRNPRRNFNVVCPLFDWLCRTLATEVDAAR